MSFASEPGRDDGNLPPLNVVIPDDARELERDVLAYHREMRAQRRRQRLAWLWRPFGRAGNGGPAAIMPLIAACLALSLVGGALLSVVTMGPASAPTVGSQTSAPPSMSTKLTTLPPASVEKPGGQPMPVRSLVTSAIALVPARCDCGQSLLLLADQAVAAKVSLYFVGTGSVDAAQVSAMAELYGDGAAVPLTDLGGALGAAYRPVKLTVLLVFQNGSAEVVSDLSGSFQLGETLSELKHAGPAAR